MNRRNYRRPGTKAGLLSFCTIGILTLGIAVLLAGCGTIDSSTVEGILRGPEPLSEETIIAGLKEALEVGTQNATELASQPGGFLENPLLFIPLPPELEEVDMRLRRIGLGSSMDDFIERMNRAAEVASAEATEVFIGSIRQMTVTDARDILFGPEDAATRYFERTTRLELSARFLPVVQEAINDTGVASLYQWILEQYNRIPLVEDKEYDLDTYVVNEGLDGLFLLIEAEEMKIREDPAARVTDLLRRVFSEQDD